MVKIVVVIAPVVGGMRLGGGDNCSCYSTCIGWYEAGWW